MIHLEFKRKSCHFSLNFEHGFNLVTGLSATGKSACVELVNKKGTEIISTNACKIYTVLNSLIKHVESDSILLIDLDDVEDVSLIDDLVRTNRDDICVVLFGRAFLNRIPISFDSIYKFVTVKGVTKNIKYSDNELSCACGTFSKVVVEDSGSGFNFIKEYFSNVSTSNGFASMVKGDYHDYLKIFDSVGCGAYIEEFLSKYKNTPYFAWKSFEGFILENVYNIKVATSGFLNVERKLYNELCALNPNYSKCSSCYTRHCLTCNKNCSSDYKDLFNKSKYSEFLKLQIIEDDPVKNIIIKHGYPIEVVDKVKQLLPTVDMPVDILETTILNAIMYL